MARIHELAIHSASIAAMMAMTFHSPAVIGPIAAQLGAEVHALDARPARADSTTG